MARNRRRKKRSNINEDLLNRTKPSLELNKLNNQAYVEEDDTDWENEEEEDDINFFLPDNFNLSLEQVSLNSPEENEKIIEKIYGKDFLDRLKGDSDKDIKDEIT